MPTVRTPRAPRAPGAPGASAVPEARSLWVARGVTIPFDELAITADTSGGPGGQHANRSSTRIEVRFDVAASPSLTPHQKALLLEALGPRLTATGVLRVVSGRERSQWQNRRAAFERLAALLARGLERPATRRATRPTQASRRERVATKRRRSTVKERRRRPAPVED